MASLIEGEWLCYSGGQFNGGMNGYVTGGGHFNGGKMVMLQSWSSVMRR